MKKRIQLVDRHKGELRETSQQFELLLWSFLWPIILIHLIQSPYLVYLRILPCMLMHFLAKMESTSQGYGQPGSS